MATQKAVANPPATLPADFNQWDSAPSSLPANFFDPQAKVTPQNPSIGPAAPLSSPKTGSAWNTMLALPKHIAGAVSGTVHAVADPPQGAAENLASMLGPAALPAYRALVKPSIDAASGAIAQYKAGNTGTLNGQQYDAQGEYKPTAISLAEDAIPFAGPWSRSIDNQAHKEGAVPALVGAAGDMLGGEIVGRGAPMAARGAGKGMELAATSPESAAMAATRSIVPGTPGDLLTRALKPGVKYRGDVQGMFADTLPDVTRAGGTDATAYDVNHFASSTDAAREANQAGYKGMVSPYKAGFGTAPRPSGVPGSVFVAPQVDSVPFLRDFEDPGVDGIKARTAQQANRLYRGTQLDVPTLDELRIGANRELHSYYNKANGDQAAALADPETARIKAVGDTARDQLYPILDADYGLRSGTTAGMQQMYGKLSDVSDIANKRDVVYSRHDPVSLAEKVAVGHPGGVTSRLMDYAGQKLLRSVTDSDALTRSAVDRYLNPDGTPLPPRNNLWAGTTSAVGRTMQQVPNSFLPSVTFVPPQRKKK